MNINELNQKHAIPGQLEFSQGQGGLPVARIRNAHAYSEISVYGAQVLKYQPVGQEDVLWMSAASNFEEGKAIRGGIPVCFPWFGPHVTDPSKPQHGFARLLMWNVLGTSALSNGSTQIRLGLSDTSFTTALWPFPFRAQLVIEVGNALEITLSYINTGDETFICSDALHSYFNVSDVSMIKIAGLQGTVYFNGFEKEATGRQTEPFLEIRKEENRRYVNHSGTCVIEDGRFKRRIHVAKKGSNVTVVWNPWESTKNMADMNTDSYKTMVCVEAVNAYEDVASVAPGKSFSVSTRIWVE